ncbi:MAG: PBECR2 nuclease fold domain-containing protein [Treponematales bacterium]
MNGAGTETPRGGVQSPLETVIVEKKIMNKLVRKHRQDILGAIRPTITDPLVIINENREGRKYHVYVKPFLDMLKDKEVMVAVVVHDDERGEITVSAYKRPDGNTLNKIKKAGDVAYEKARDAGFTQ